MYHSTVQSPPRLASPAMAAKRSSTEFTFVASSRLLGGVVVLLFLMIISTRPPPPSPAALAYASTAETAAPSWTKWASDKFSESPLFPLQLFPLLCSFLMATACREMGLRQENARAASGKMKEKAEYIAAKAKDALSSAAEYAFHKAGEVKDSVAVMAGSVVRIIRTEVRGGDEAAAEAAYEGAKQRVAESGESAKETASGCARRSYEAAKEEESQAAGDLGDKLQEMAKEL